MLCVLIRIASSGRFYGVHTIYQFNIKKKITLNYPISAAVVFFLCTEERVQNSRGKRATSVRATEGLLYIGIKDQDRCYTQSRAPGCMTSCAASDGGG